MSRLLDLYPLPWAEPALRELRDALAMTVYRDRDIEAIAVDAGISPGDIAWDQPARLLWHQVLEEAAGRRLLPALLDVVVDRRPALLARVGELTADQPVVEAPVPADDRTALGAADPRWRNFSADGRERIIVEGQKTMIDVAFLEQGLRRAPAVCRLTVGMGGSWYYGTAFRIGRRTLLTNHHVLHDWKHDREPADQVQAAFGYELDTDGTLRKPTVIRCDPATIRGEGAHDFAVIDVAEPLPDEIPVLSIEAGATVAADDRVYIVQHPGGLPKKIGLHNNLVRHADQDVIQYWTDTEQGSSGSPVFDERWQVVGLHHRWVDVQAGDGPVYRNQGRAIARVVARMEALGITGWRAA